MEVVNRRCAVGALERVRHRATRSAEKAACAQPGRFGLPGLVVTI
jgi:hypothetical protein